MPRFHFRKKKHIFDHQYTVRSERSQTFKQVILNHMRFIECMWLLGPALASVTAIRDYSRKQRNATEWSMV